MAGGLTADILIAFCVLYIANHCRIEISRAMIYSDEKALVEGLCSSGLKLGSKCLLSFAPDNF